MAKADFRTLVAAAEQDPENADFRVLRQAYVASDAYDPTGHFPLAKLQGRTNACHSLEEVEVVCKKILKDNSMDLEARMMLEFVYDQLKQFDLAAHHHTFVTNMLDAMTATGDGKSIESAWEVVSVAEEYTLLSVTGLRMQEQTLVESEGRYFDVLNCVPRQVSGTDPVELYFDITAPFQYLQNLFG